MNRDKYLKDYAKKRWESDKIKLSIAYKETRESKYWINLLKDSGYLTDKEANSIILDCEELAKIITKILKTTKLNVGDKS